MERVGLEEIAFRNANIQFYQVRFSRFGYQWLYREGLLQETGKQSGSKHWARLYKLPVKARCRLDTGERLWDAYLISDNDAHAIVEEEKVGLFRGPNALGLGD